MTIKEFKELLSTLEENRKIIFYDKTSMVELDFDSVETPPYENLDTIFIFLF